MLECILLSKAGIFHQDCCVSGDSALLQVPHRKLQLEALPTEKEQGLCVGATFRIAVRVLAKT